MPPLGIKILLESNPVKSRILVQTLAVSRLAATAASTANRLPPEPECWCTGELSGTRSRHSKDACTSQCVTTASFQKFNPETWAQPLGDLNFQRAFEVKMSNGSGVRDPQFEMLRVEIVRTDRITSRRDGGLRGENRLPPEPAVFRSRMPCVGFAASAPRGGRRCSETGRWLLAEEHVFRDVRLSRDLCRRSLGLTSN